MPAHLWLPESGSGPGLVLVQEIFGVSRYIRARAADLARLGYVVCAPEVYWRLDGYEFDETGVEAVPQAMAVVQRVDWDLAVADVAAALGHLRGLVGKSAGCGLIGFCFGGGLAFNVAAITDPDVLVSYYGSALDELLPLAGRVRAPSLHHFGLADSFIPLPMIRQIEAAVTAHGARFETYPGADHAFDNPLPGYHHPAASAAAWRTTTTFLAEHLPVEQNRSRA